jgi:hypothetical protein
MSRTDDLRVGLASDLVAAVRPAGQLDMTSLLFGERAALLDLLGGLDPSGWQAPTECPAWSVKGIALHLLGDDLSLLSRQRDDATNSLAIFSESIAV